MLFNSFHFVFFFPIIVGLYFLLAPKYRQILLLAGSWYFYMSWKPEYLILIVISTLIDYLVSIRMDKTTKKSQRKILLAISIVMNFSLLGAFKYLNFFSTIVNDFCETFNIFANVPLYNLLLPVGISFYTFQTVSYSIDVYRRNIKAERNFITFALFVSYFPQLVAGPIERAGKLIPQLKKVVEFDYKRVSSGLKLMFWGFFKKVVVADNLSNYVDAVYSNSHYFKGMTIVIASIFFAWQIYCDFSGYSDIATGAARILGVNLSLNFRHPFLSRSFREFWQNWHVTLAIWFRDYVFKVLKSTKFIGKHIYLMLFIILTLSGLWHGANYTFLVWGIYCSVTVILEDILLNIIKKRFPGFLEKKLVVFFRIIYTFMLFAFASLFFRAENIKDSFELISNIFRPDFQIANIWFIGMNKFIFNILLIILLIYVHLLERKTNIVDFVSSKPVLARYLIYYTSFMILILTGNFGLKEFFYFRF